MKKITPLVCLLTFYSFLINAQVILKFSNDTLNAYTFNGGDEFNKPVLNENEWINGLPWARVLMSQDVAFAKKNISLKDSLINFLAIKEDSTYVLAPWEIDSAYLKQSKMKITNGKFLTKYSVGCIASKQKYHYGIYEVRFMADKGRGVWPAFWFYGGNKNEEIDGFELKGERNNEIHVDTHCPYGCDRGYKNKIGLNTNWGGWLPVSNYLSDGFNIMHLEWKKDEIIWYINGYPLAYFKGKFANPMNLYLNSSVAKDGGAFKPGPDETTTWPNNYYVDYFRSWQEVEKGKDIVLKANDALTSSNKFVSDYNNKPVKKRGLMYKKKTLNKIDGIISISLSSNHKLKLNALGKIKDIKTSLTIRGLSSNKVTDLSNFKNEAEVVLNPTDSEIVVTIKTENKTFNQKLTLKP